jgi:hypothetical protein
MSTGTTKAPTLPVAPSEYDFQYFNQLITILRLYFQQLDNPGLIAGSTQRISATNIKAALNFSQVDPTTGLRVVSFPTQTELAYLKIGDVYYDTSAGNVLKIKTS